MKTANPQVIFKMTAEFHLGKAGKKTVKAVASLKAGRKV